MGRSAQALREAPTGHRYDRVPTAKMTAVCVLVACLFPGAGYDAVLATAFGLPGLRLKLGTGTPTGSAFSEARKLLGEQAMKKIFELDAAVSDADLGTGLLWRGLEVTAIDGTTMELARNNVLADAFGTPAEGARPMLRITAHARTVTFRWIGAATSGYHDGENALADHGTGFQALPFHCRISALLPLSNGAGGCDLPFPTRVLRDVPAWLGPVPAQPARLPRDRHGQSVHPGPIGLTAAVSSGLLAPWPESFSTMAEPKFHEG
jgi:hypothetical protein